MKQDSKPVMSNTVDKHTPGKWYMNENGYIKSDNGEPELWQQKAICRMFGDSKEREADGSLIAIVPQLKKENEELKGRNRVLVEALKIAAIHVSSISFKSDWEIVSEALQSNQ